MVLFFVTYEQREPLDVFLGSWAARLDSRARLFYYEDLWGTESLPAAATYVFTDLERLTCEERRLAAAYADQLAAAPGAPRILNHPARTLGRYDLLRALFELDINPFQAYRVLARRRPRRFPVFLRYEDDHDGPVSQLLRTQRDVDQAVARAYVLGGDLASLLMVEFQDTADDEGIFRRYTVYLIGDELIVGNLAFGSDWVVKYNGKFTAEQFAEKRATLSSRAHDAPLREVAELAGISWGRFDYAVVDGRICVWELNTNPTLLLHPDEYPPGVRVRRGEMADRLTEAIGRLAGDPAERPPVKLFPGHRPASAAPRRAPRRRRSVAPRPVRALARLAPGPFLRLMRLCARARGRLAGQA